MRRLASAFSVVLAQGLFGCSDAIPEETSEGALEVTEPQSDALKIHLSESPSQGPHFTFCSAPSPDAPLHLTNAAWLALASANQYSHLGYFAPHLLDLGFGSPADSLWAQCGRDLGRARDFEVSHKEELHAKEKEGPEALLKFMRHRDVMSPENFGVCARDFFENKYTARDDDGHPELPAAAFKNYLLRQTDDTNWIQFFSAKPYTLLERLMNRGSTQVTIARHSTEPIVIVAFRGTEPPKASDLQARDLIDIFKDLDIFKSKLTNYGFQEGWGYAHRGFVTALQSVDDTDSTSLLTNKIRQLTGNDPKIGVWITGHSLGGALATLMTARLLDRMDRGEPFTLRGMYTFGSPMVGNDEFRDKMAASARRHGVPLVRFRNDQDAVTGIPGVMAFLNYHHVGRLALLGPGGFATPDSDPALVDDRVSDHDIAGILGPFQARTRTSGYYSRILTALERGAAPALTACATPASPPASPKASE